ncbi:MAG: hypothetical protein O8C64_05780 [Candidatus Methanoperedens sp.]|nr:hypothetical protein [Candidatus Methanoperedens sp.]MCZ7405349.1 hypothetical protein [Candidatus Methanoperedens sp.]
MSYKICASAATVQFAVDDKPYAFSNTVTLVINGSKTILNKTVNCQVSNITKNAAAAPEPYVTRSSYSLFAIIALLFISFRRR